MAGRNAVCREMHGKPDAERCEGMDRRPHESASLFIRRCPGRCTAERRRYRVTAHGGPLPKYSPVTMEKPLSKHMLAALDALRVAPLRRYPGGFWAHDGAKMVPSTIWGFDYPVPSHTVDTLRALKRRGLAVFTDHAEMKYALPGGKLQMKIWETKCEATAERTDHGQ